jgi:hypothetical protein
MSIQDTDAGIWKWSVTLISSKPSMPAKTGLQTLPLVHLQSCTANLFSAEVILTGQMPPEWATPS